MHAPYKHPKQHLTNIDIEVTRYLDKNVEYSAGDIDEAVKRLIAAWPERNYDYEHTKKTLIEKIIVALKLKLEGGSHAKHTA